jgi:hypothetical protein
VTLTLEELFDEFRAQFSRAKYVAGLLLAFIDLVDAAGAPGGWADVQAFLSERRVDGKNQLVVRAQDGRNVSLRSIYDRWKDKLRNEEGRGGYPSGAPQAVGSWERYVHWLDIVLGISPKDRKALRDKVHAYVLAELPVEPPSQRHGRPLADAAATPSRSDASTTAARARLIAVTLERFKSYEGETRIELAPLTVLLGRNNGGKSSIIQSLLLLKQTLADPRPEVPLQLEPLVDAFNLRELTFGWPSANGMVVGPTLAVEWEAVVDVGRALKAARSDRDTIITHAGLTWLRESAALQTLRSVLRVETAERAGTTVLTSVRLTSPSSSGEPKLTLTLNEGGVWRASWNEQSAPKIEVEMEHFIPYLRIARGDGGPRDKQWAWFSAYLILWEQPLQALRALLSGFQYLGSTRSPPPSLYRSATVAPQEIGVSGEFAAQLLHRRQNDLVHHLPLVQVAGDRIDVPETVQTQPLTVAVNQVLRELDVGAEVSVHAVQEVGFRLLFGNAGLQHVGRGLTFLLPLIELGLLADPLGGAMPENRSLADYQADCRSFSHIALEEPESHLHPKVQSRLAQWLVSLARSNRRLIVETHSDHLVRRLRGMVARAKPGSVLEQWLLDNVVIVEVEQVNGRSSVKSSRLTREGGLGESWPADFMDVARDEDSAIFDSGLAKRDPDGEPPAFIHDEGGDVPEEER